MKVKLQSRNKKLQTPIFTTKEIIFCLSSVKGNWARTYVRTSPTAFEDWERRGQGSRGELLCYLFVRQQWYLKRPILMFCIKGRFDSDSIVWIWLLGAWETGIFNVWEIGLMNLWTIVWIMAGGSGIKGGNLILTFEIR